MNPPFFVIGFQRSGTTLLRLMLDSHPMVAIPLDVTGLWSRYEERLAGYGDLGEERNVHRLIGDLLAEERIRLWEANFGEPEIQASLAEIEGHRDGSAPARGEDGAARYPALIAAFYTAYAREREKSRWGDKDPGNMTRIHRIHGWFPDARFLHIVRDGRDACLSHLRQTFGFDDILACAEAWREEVCWVRRIGRLLGSERYHELRYEDLVTDPERELRPVCEFLELPWSEAMLTYHRRTEQAIPASKRHIWNLIDRPPQRDNVDRWKTQMSAGARICFEKRAGPLLREVGYETLPEASGAYLEELKHLLGGAWRATRRRLRRG